jgi:predicted ATP-dependent endonuclease of OLD family
MRVVEVQVRFYRSFNYDYELKADPRATPRPWEEIDGSWYPFIVVELDPVVTAVVGANESGKSHLVKATQQALSGEGIDHRDFCRYSALYSVREGEIRSPDFGLGLEVSTDAERDQISAAAIPWLSRDRLKIFRLDEGQRVIAIGKKNEISELDEDQRATLQSLMPLPFTIEATVALPDSISFGELLDEEPSPLASRASRSGLERLLGSLRSEGAEGIERSAQQIYEFLDRGAEEETPTEDVLSEADLARMLLLEVAEISKRSIADLRDAVRAEDEGQVGGLLERMNKALAQRLNFSRWWRQDRDFQLRVDTREHELVFTIRDRTGTEYSFEERSRGLQYFLSYYVQLLARRRSGKESSQVLLMDEPDAYLSSLGQQDLLRALEEFARPSGGGSDDQVLYVTHSPFLINKNAAHRIRVLDKGTNEEGTRIVGDVAHNYYEPLRSALGAYVAETTFIGGANLLVEGLSDQVLLTGVAALLRKHGTSPSRLMNLNEVTIVPAGGASSVPYMAYLARGRGDLKAACVALLDGDEEGQKARRQLLRKATGRAKPTLPERYVVDLGDWIAKHEPELPADVIPREPEDLIPIELALEAARNYAARLPGLKGSDITLLTADAIGAAVKQVDGSLWKAVKKSFVAAFEEASIEKVGFAKELIALLEASAGVTPSPPAITRLEANFAPLMADLAALLREADAEESEERSEKRSEQVVRIFLRDHPEGAERHEADQTLMEIEASLEGTPGDEAVRNHLAAVRQGFDLATDPLEPVDDFGRLSEELRNLRSIRRRGHQEAAKVAPVGKGLTPSASKSVRREKRKSAPRGKRRTRVSGGEDENQD